MSLLEILQFPDERLRRVAEPVSAFDAALKELTEQMLETMYESRGVGLAATQVNIHRRLFVADCAGDGEAPAPMVFINPVIVDRQGMVDSEEGCLSIPGINDTVSRAELVKVQAQDERGEAFEVTTDGLLAICIQHEIDHLDGRLFIDYLSPLKRQRIRKKFDKVLKLKERP
ncbi:peptide deformylase [Halothiobacillus diazotrophicus]|uniref:Peptide deformylase n=1 Tax=Halothiobacillus diazotrophicus TaxID=1860122 RepID=A0A191ZKL4_9GAMM|nr:peptide deformylase [Halothiobacillus diazotrophicus]ANJ68419.1 peptide deformylase [Halothiobacillus diazotrophicus]